jgi:GntR family transcriptional regulator, transcriptional repressor for pyruvate dehydrogenase complex
MRLHKLLAVSVRDEIVSGSIGPGDRLPTVPALARAWGVGAAAARDALLALEERGVVSVKPQRGVVVNAIERWNVLASIRR